MVKKMFIKSSLKSLFFQIQSPICIFWVHLTVHIIFSVVSGIFSSHLIKGCLQKPYRLFFFLDYFAFCCLLQSSFACWYFQIFHTVHCVCVFGGQPWTRKVWLVKNINGVFKVRQRQFHNHPYHFLQWHNLCWQPAVQGSYHSLGNRLSFDGFLSQDTVRQPNECTSLWTLPLQVPLLGRSIQKLPWSQQILHHTALYSEYEEKLICNGYASKPNTKSVGHWMWWMALFIPPYGRSGQVVMLHEKLIWSIRASDLLWIVFQLGPVH